MIKYTENNIQENKSEFKLNPRHQTEKGTKIRSQDLKMIQPFFQHHVWYQKNKCEMGAHEFKTLLKQYKRKYYVAVNMKLCLRCQYIQN